MENDSIAWRFYAMAWNEIIHWHYLRWMNLLKNRFTYFNIVTLSYCCDFFSACFFNAHEMHAFKCKIHKSESMRTQWNQAEGHAVKKVKGARERGQALRGSTLLFTGKCCTKSCSKLTDYKWKIWWKVSSPHTRKKKKNRTTSKERESTIFDLKDHRTGSNLYKLQTQTKRKTKTMYSYEWSLETNFRGEKKELLERTFSHYKLLIVSTQTNE